MVYMYNIQRICYKQDTFIYYTPNVAYSSIN